MAGKAKAPSTKYMDRLTERDTIFKDALAGNRNAALMALELLVYTLKERADDDLYRYFKSCYERVSNGENVKDAFNLKGRKSTRQRDTLLVAHYEFWQREHAAGRIKVDFQKLQDELAEAFGMDTDTVRKQIQRFQKRRAKGQ